MRTCRLAMLLLGAVSGLCPSDAPPAAAAAHSESSTVIESFTMTDGRILVGHYDERDQRLTLMDDQTSGRRQSIPLSAAAIVARHPVPLGAPPPESHPAVTPTASVAGAHGDWIDNYDQAMTSARLTHRPILIDFTGSDWCGGCIRLHHEVFESAEFIDWSAQHVILLVIDLPHHHALPRRVAKQNEQLAMRFAITSVPSVYLLDAAGNILVRTTYRPGGAHSWIADVVARAQLP